MIFPTTCSGDKGADARPAAGNMYVDGRADVVMGSQYLDTFNNAFANLGGAHVFPSTNLGAFVPISMADAHQAESGGLSHLIYGG